jgi:hypothetical protein
MHRPLNLLNSFYEAADSVKPFVVLPIVHNSTERAPFTQPRALAIVLIAISAWKTASAVILLFVLSGGDLVAGAS